MTFVEGFLTPCPTANKDKYVEHAQEAVPLFQRLGSTRFIEAWGEDVPDGNKEKYRDMAARMAPIFREHGAVRVVEAWGDDVPDGKVTDYRKAAHAKDGENVVYSFVEWPSREARDAGWAKIMADERMQPSEADKDVFDGKRMFWGGFKPIVDTEA